jgi:serine/threonine-protein kinase RsbW
MYEMGAEDHRHPPSLAVWASSLPPLAADVVTDADLTTPYLYLVLGTSASRLAALRSRVSDWAYELGLPTEEREDIVMAVDEAVSNVVRHAFPAKPGMVTLFAARDKLAHAVHVTVSDRGTWRTVLDDSGVQRLGLRMMDQLADVFDVHHDDEGTTVVMRWSLPSSA